MLNSYHLPKVFWVSADGQPAWVVDINKKDNNFFLNVKASFFIYNGPQKHEFTLLHTNACTERIFNSRPFVYKKIFLKKLLQKLLAHIFTLLLAPFASKLINHLRHSESLKNIWKWSNRRKMSSILNSSESLKSHCTVPRIIDHLDVRGAKRSLMWATNV